MSELVVAFVLALVLGPGFWCFFKEVVHEAAQDGSRSVAAVVHSDGVSEEPEEFLRESDARWHSPVGDALLSARPGVPGQEADPGW